MIKIVYVHVGSTSSKYHKMLQISLASVRLNMPNIEVNVVVDKSTEKDLISNESAILKDQFLSVISVDIAGNYKDVEKSRYLKTSLRTHVSGDFLFIDTDTVICCDFSDIVVDKSVSMVLDEHTEVSNDDWSENLKNNAKVRGFDFSNLEYYFNSGVMIVRDDPDAHKLFDKWFLTWDKTRKLGFHQDQYSLAEVNQNLDIITQLDPRWNFQVSGHKVPLELISEAKIIHYFATTSRKLYILNNVDVFNSELDGPLIKGIIESPKTALNPFSIVISNTPQDDIIKSSVFELLLRFYRKKNVFKFLCRISSNILSINERCNRIYQGRSKINNKENKNDI